MIQHPFIPPTTLAEISTHEIASNSAFGQTIRQLKKMENELTALAHTFQAPLNTPLSFSIQNTHQMLHFAQAIVQLEPCLQEIKDILEKSIFECKSNIENTEKYSVTYSPLTWLASFRKVDLPATLLNNEINDQDFSVKKPENLKASYKELYHTTFHTALQFNKTYDVLKAMLFSQKGTVTLNKINLVEEPEHPLSPRLA